MAATFDEIDGWIIIEMHSQYNCFYIVFYLFILIGFLFGSPPRLPLPPKISYTLENKNTRVRRTITLDGDHKREDLIAAVGRSR